MSTITVKQKEAKTIRFTVTDTDGAVDLSSATLSFMVKRNYSDADASAIITKADGVFLRTLPYDDELGIVGLALSATDLDQTDGVYICELKTIFSASNIDKSAELSLIIKQAVHTA